MSVDLCEQIYSDSSDEAIKRLDFASQKGKELNQRDCEAHRSVGFDDPEGEGESIVTAVMQKEKAFSEG